MGRVVRGILALTMCGAFMTTGAQAAGPQPGTPEYVQRDTQNMLDAYGRQTAPDGQLSANYLNEFGHSDVGPYLQQVANQAANPTRPILDPGQWIPGWNAGSAYRQHWAGTRGQEIPVAFTNRYGALLRGDVFAPLPGARDPYTRRKLRGPYPGVVITTGSIQGSERMYCWLAQDLAERGYVVLTYDVQGQGTSETFPHLAPHADIPFCDPSRPRRRASRTSAPVSPSSRRRTSSTARWTRSTSSSPRRAIRIATRPRARRT